MEFRLPDLGENIEQGELIRILVSEGDTVEKDQPVLELETDKALLEVPAPVSGVVSKLIASPGTMLKIGAPIMEITESSGGEKKPEPKKPKAPAQKKEDPAPPPQTEAKEEAPPKAAKPEAAKPEAERDVSDSPSVDPARVAAEQNEENPRGSEPGKPARVLDVPGKDERPVAAAPSTRRLARELGVDLSQVKGTGPGGRISSEDVKGHVKGNQSAAEASKNVPAPLPDADRKPNTSLPDFEKWGTVRRERMTGIRRKTMEHLSHSWTTIPHVTQFDEADVTELESLRKRHAQNAAQKGGKLTATVFVMKAVVAAMKQFPRFNASVDEENEELIFKDYFHVGIAVETEHGLMVPVIRDVDKKHLLDLSAEVSMISERTRNRKLKLEEMQGGSMTISNLGGLGGTAFTPIINHPEVAILGLSRYQRRLMMHEERIETRLIMPLSLSYDHRVIDGADAVRFTRKIADMLEDPALLLLE